MSINAINVYLLMYLILQYLLYLGYIQIFFPLQMTINKNSKNKKKIRKPYENNPLDKRQKYPQRTVFNI